MTSRALRLIVIPLTVAALLLISCGPKAVPGPVAPAPTAPSPVPVTPAPTPAPTTTLQPASAEKPKYGGIFNMVMPTDITVWDTAFTRGSDTLGSCCNHNQLQELIWEKGSAGSGEFDFSQGTPFEAYGQGLAESWKVPDQYTWIFQIRRGVRYQMPAAEANMREAHRLVNGREMTVDDIIYNFTRLMKTHIKTSGIGIFQPGLSRAASFEKTGAWELTLKFPVDPFTSWFWVVEANWGSHAPEVIEKWGKTGPLDWQQRVGTGPFIVIDFVPGSAVTMVKSANYWGRNPVGPGKNDQSPYIDTLKYLVVPDISTRLAVMRTGKGDWVEALQGEDTRSLLKTAPTLKSARYLGRPFLANGRLDRPDQPWANKRVRQALQMATNMETLKNDLYDGDAIMLFWPISPDQPPYVPLEKQPKHIQELFSYNPEKAKQLLTEAGYPNGFKAKMLVESSTEMLDAVSALKAMWAKVGVEIELQARDTATFTAITGVLGNEELILRTTTSTFPAAYPAMTNIRGPSMYNISRLNEPIGSEPRIEEMFQRIQKQVIVNQAEADRLYREEFIPYVLELADRIPVANPYFYAIWQPWVKSYNGESWSFAAKFFWIDQDLKEQLTGRR